MLTGKTCLVTGGSRGIGAAIARAAAAVGANVAVNYLYSEMQADTLVEELKRAGSNSLAVRADVSQVPEVEDMFCEIEDKLGEVELLVNNSGISLRGLLQEISEEDWDRVINVNLKGPFLCCRRALPAMIRKKYGRIVNIASTHGITGASFESAYAASKGGLIALTRSLGSEVAPSGINVNALAPGPVATDMLYAELNEDDLKLLADEIPAGRLAKPEEVASACLFLLSEQASYINGQILSIDGGWKAG